MNKDECNKKFAKYIGQIRENLKIIQQQPNDSNIQYTTDDLKKLIEEGKIPKEMGERELRCIEEQNCKFSEWQKNLKDNPTIPAEEQINRLYELHKTLSHEEALKYREEMVNHIQTYHMLMEIIVNNHVNKYPPTDKERQLFRIANSKENFGVSNLIANAMYHLIGLLQAELENPYSNNWVARGTMKNSYGLSMSLEYEFQAASKEEAQKKLEEYREFMKTKGIKTWMAYWAAANEYGSPEYSCPFIEIMKHMSDPDRATRFEADERQRCWDGTKILKKSTIKIERFIKKSKDGKSITRWVEQPLVAILGGERELEEKYPLQVVARVLSAGINKKEFAPTIYNKKTLGLHPSDALLAFILQTRAAQSAIGENKGYGFDWNYLFKLCNLQKTAETNSREAKVKVRRKINNLKNLGIIDTPSEDKFGVRINRKKT